MKKLLLLLFTAATFFSQDFDRNIMIEIFTNSHCPLCPTAHSTIDSYLAGSPNADKVRYIYYHMSYPYSDDQLNQANPEDASGRNQYYGPFSSTPRAFFDGEIQSNNYNQWVSNINERLTVKSPVNIRLSGNVVDGDVVIDADIEMSSSFSANGLVVHFIIVEDVEYDGRNGIDNHKNVMREMITGPEGESISISSQQQISKSFNLNSNWNPDDITLIVFVQNSSTMEVYQSESVDYSELVVTGIKNEGAKPVTYSLEQNYPNPFNPTTTINYGLAESGFAELKVFDVLGNEMTELIGEEKSAGLHSLQFDASALPSGVYFYTLTTENFVQTRKMLFIK